MHAEGFVLHSARFTALLGSVVGVFSILLPWWILEWTWEGGLFERSTFLYGNSIRGDLSGLGVAGTIGVNVPAYTFASYSLVLVLLAFVAGVYGGLGSSPRNRFSLVLSTLLFFLSSLVFVIGLSSALSMEGRRIFASETLASSGSHVTTGLASGFYLVVAAIVTVGFSYLVERRSVKRGKLPLRGQATTTHVS